MSAYEYDANLDHTSNIILGLVEVLQYQAHIK